MSRFEVFVVVREVTATPGGVADARFSLPEAVAMLRSARMAVRASREGHPGAQQDIVHALERSASRGDPEQARGVLVASLLREAAAEDDAMLAARADEQAMAHQAMRAAARDASFAPAPPMYGGAAPRGYPVQSASTPPPFVPPEQQPGVPPAPVSAGGRSVDGVSMEQVEAARAWRREQRAREDAARAEASRGRPAPVASAAEYRARKLAEQEAQAAPETKSAEPPAEPRKESA